MKNKVYTTPFFESRYKRLVRKFPSIQGELEILEKELISNPKLGEPLGGNLYKIRLASKDKGKGKSGGFRVITYLIQEFTSVFEIYLITIYDKSEDKSIPKKVLIKLVKDIFF
jgi:hypothetical protein